MTPQGEEQLLKDVGAILASMRDYERRFEDVDERLDDIDERTRDLERWSWKTTGAYMACAGFIGFLSTHTDSLLSIFTKK